ncbi:glycoside hydrolase family 3 C-terminal domain-containing protein [Robertkochia solimangrovi]|uniref:glycoside hydrolase family 3 C-terminal domain-containing protein n=1 Tax=Robertkochia solimangrovi TaxID=2213046 RepID=UPI00117D8430|nr:glycoside hydrolase family 3 C-terminal domain-containing protein [Robertkochia solimangrovi]TRZ42500.1 glycoside hydrolase family 3 protein [Robertkochia solimangrovi]
MNRSPKFIFLPLIFLLLIASCKEHSSEEGSSSDVETTTSDKPDFPFYDTALSTDERIADLISRLTLEEKALQMTHNTPPVERLGIPAYSYWNEALHGVGRSGVATVFPQAIGLGATFDSDLAFRVANAISDEARAMYNASAAKGYNKQYGGLTFWTPNINIFRDPRWGRGQETYGEDPYLTGLLGGAFVDGLQGDDPDYLKTAACAKHYAVHSGPEKLRHQFNAVASDKDLWETYLPAFKTLVDHKVEAVMCAYNSTNGEPCCANEFLISDVLRERWGFKGHVLSDCWAITDFYNVDNGHGVVDDAVAAAALAVKSGVSLNCGSSYPNLPEAVAKGYLTEKEIDEQLAILLRTRFRLGLFDPKGSNKFDAIKPEVINSKEHRQLAREVAQKGMVLLKNNGVLPLRNDLSNYYVTGPNAASVEVLLGNYYGVNPELVTFLEGIANAIEPGSQLQYRMGALLDRDPVNPQDWASGNAGTSDATIAVLGISGLLEGEEGESIASPSFGDRLDYDIPANQITYLKKLRNSAGERPIISVITGGSPINLAEVQALSDAVIFAWYPGEEGGNALADIIFGKVNPSGRLPLTFPKSLDQLPPYEDYSMKGRTYKYMKAAPLFPFGYGLSYTTFTYSDPQVTLKQTEEGSSATLTFNLHNTGKVAGEEVVQCYLHAPDAEFTVPNAELKSVKRVFLEPGETTTVTMELDPKDLRVINDAGESVQIPGQAEFIIGGCSPMKVNDLPIAKMIRVTFQSGA